MKYLKLFETEAEYTQFKNSEDYVLPNVSYVDNSNVVMYNPNAASVSLIEFTICGTPYQAEEGMTWQEFVESSYNDGNVVINNKYVNYNGHSLANPSGMSYMTNPSDLIVANHNYEIAAV